MNADTGSIISTFPVEISVEKSLLMTLSFLINHSYDRLHNFSSLCPFL